MKALTIQPTLTPCHGSLDLISDISSCGEFIELTWGTTLFMRIPKDRQTAIFRILAGLLCQCGFGQGTVSRFLGVSTKTLGRWRNCLVTGTWDSLSVLFEGIHPRKCPEYLREYARRRYREFIDSGQVSPVHGYNRLIAEEIQRYWGVAVSCESLRLIFRDEDLIINAEETCLANGAPQEAALVDGGQTENHELFDNDDAACPPFADAPVAEADGTPCCESAEELSEDSSLPRKVMSDDGDSDLEDAGEIAGDESTATAFSGFAGPALYDQMLSQPLFSAHAGLFILSPWFEEAFGLSRPIVRQTAAQILLGGVNQEQAKSLSFSCLKPFIPAPIRSPQWQRRQLDEAVLADAASDVWRANAALIGAGRCHTFYFDPHVAVYTGKENYVKTWSGLDKAPKKGVNLDFFHTATGFPCYIGHDDGYYDARQRFLMIIQQMRWAIEAGDYLTVVMDRGFWGQEFMQAMIQLKLCFIQWEKNYKDNGWDEPFVRAGRMSLIRRKNHKHDRKKVRFSFREQVWPNHPGGRRLIVRTRDLKGKNEEFSIVTNNPALRPEEIIRLMFNRWIQEGDFSYQNSHFGMNQQTARKTLSYAELQDSLQDREIDARDYADRRQERTSQRHKLGKLLITLATTSNPSPAALEARRQRLKARHEELKKALAHCDPTTTKSEFLDKISRQIARLTTSVSDAQHQHQQIEKRRELEAEADQLHQTLSDLDELISEMPKKESRLNRMIQNGKVKPDLGRKALVDAIRVTSRNIFCQAHAVLRPIYNDFREDHITLRQLTRSPGVITQNADGTLNLFLRPRLDRQPEQWRRIRSFIDIVEHRIRNQFGVQLTFHLDRSDAQIFDAAARMNERLKTQNQRK